MSKGHNAQNRKLSVGRGKDGDCKNYGGTDHFREIRSLIENSIGEKDGVDLLLEVEIDESLRELLSQSSVNKGNDLLDVTIIQKAESLRETTVSLNVTELSDFLEMVNHHNAYERRNFVEPREEKVKNSFAKKRHEDKTNHYFDCATGKEIPQKHSKRRHRHDADRASEFSSEYKEQFPIETQVYTTPYTFNDMKKKLPCLNKGRPSEDKPGTPCLCQHCGMVGVLVESQKRPHIPHAANPKYIPPPKSTSRKQGSNPPTHQHHEHDYMTKSKSDTNIAMLRELAKKIQSLEKRLCEHEEKTVRKDYFKLVIHKLLDQYSAKLNDLKRNQEKTVINSSTQYAKTIPRSPSREGRHKTSWDRGQIPERDKKIHLMKTSSKESIMSDRRFSAHRSRQRERDDSPNRAKSKQRKVIKAPERDNDILRLPANVDEMLGGMSFNRHVYTAKAPGSSPFRSPSPNAPFDKATFMQTLEKEIDEHASTETIKKLCDLVYNKCSEKYKEKSQATRKPRDDSNFRKTIQAHKSARPDGIPEKLLNKNDKVNISYVNPSVKTWHDEQSSDDLGLAGKKKVTPSNKHSIEGTKNARYSLRKNLWGKFGTHGIYKRKQKTTRSFDKINYLKTLARKKNVDETELWNNILNQAKKHIKSNEDTVSIQLPGGTKNTGMSELELTLSNLKEIVKKARGARKNRSSVSIDLAYRSSSDFGRRN